MGLSIGIAGLPNVGKSTLLNALTHAGAEASNYPFCTIDENVGMATVPDPNLARLETILHPHETHPAAIRFVDVAGLIRGASKGEGLGNRFLGHLRDTDAILHVVRCFDDENIVHATGSVDPVRDVEIVETELLLADLETAERGLARWARTVKSGTGAGKDEEAAFTRAVEALRAGTPLARADLTEEELRHLDEVRFLTVKPSLYLANTGEDDPEGKGPHVQALRQAKESKHVLPVSVEIEEEISELPSEEQKDFLEGLGLRHTALDLVIRASYDLLDLLTFYTIANDKLQAWPLRRGSTVVDAAGRIHSDMARGFIRAEVMTMHDLVNEGSRQALHDRGLIHVVGKTYAVQPEDVLQIHFKA